MGIVQMYVNNSWQNLLYIPQMLNFKTFYSFSFFPLSFAVTHFAALNLFFFFLNEIIIKYGSLQIFFMLLGLFLFFFSFLKLLECHKYYFSS